MRKLFLNIAVLATAGSAVIPATACTFNFYETKVKDKIAQGFALATGQIIKALVLSKTLNVDTQKTINDYFSAPGQTNIKNQSQSGTFNNWGDFVRTWGANGQIDISGFDQDQYVVGTGQGILTKKITSLEKTDDFLSVFKYLQSLSIINNKIVYNLAIAPNSTAHSTVVNLLANLQTQQADPNPSSGQKLIGNLINHYQTAFVAPLTSVLAELVNGWPQAPKNLTALKTYMEQWKDQDNYYSQWIKDGKWTLTQDPTWTKGWTTNDYTLYRGGALINYTFKKIGQEFQISQPGKDYQDRYLGDIISNHIPDIIGGKYDKIASDFKQYLPHIIENPAYILALVQGLMPVIKRVILNMTDVSQGVHNLTVGQGYPTDPANHSWNLKTVFLNLQAIINDPTKIKTLIEHLLALPFFSDIQVLGQPFSVWLKNFSQQLQPLITTIINFLTSDSFKAIFNTIGNYLTRLNDQYATGGINLDLRKLQAFLVTDDTAILNLLNQTMNDLSTIIKPDAQIDDQAVNTLYCDLGGILPKQGQEAPESFQPNSFLATIKNQFTTQGTVLNTLIAFIYLNGDKKGIVNFIIADHKQWIDDNYTQYLDLNNLNTTITNASCYQITNNGQQITQLNYDLSFTIKNQVYKFEIAAIAEDQIAGFTGTNNFKFQAINKINL